MKKALKTLAFLGLVSLQFTHAQGVVTSVDGQTGTSNQIPVYSQYEYSYSQYIYLASDFHEDVQGAESIITSISFYNETGSLLNTDLWEIGMTNSTKEFFTSGADGLQKSEFTIVFDDVIAPIPQFGWVEIELSTPFVWDGVSNVIVSVYEKNEEKINVSNGEIPIEWGVVATEGQKRAINMPNNDEITALHWGSLSEMVPMTKFTHLSTSCADIDASVSYIIEANIEEPLCEGSTVTLNFLDFENYEGITYQWQKELDGEWLDIEGETENTFVGELTESTDIRLALTCNENGEWIYTETLSLEVTPIPSDIITLNHVFFGEKTVDFTVENTHNSYSYEWAFGDGETETTEAPGVAHEYGDYGEYIMTLTISNDCGEYVLTETINIQNAGIATENIVKAQIFPNPAKDFITITLDNANAATVLLLDATGREVKTLAMNKSTTIAVGDWSKGVYFAHILTENTKFILQFIVK